MQKQARPDECDLQSRADNLDRFLIRTARCAHDTPARERGHMADASRERQDRILTNQTRIIENHRTIIGHQRQSKQVL